ncbi:MAG: class I SAM-dependent methyltransferase family protein [Promethearchaeia archaeon]
MTFKDKLQSHLKNTLPKKKLEVLPSGFQTLGKVVVIKLKPELFPHEEKIAQAYLDLLPYIRSVYINRGKIEGQYRTPEGIEYLAGEKDPIVQHKEHGVLYEFDITKIMFSQGNLRERKFLSTLVDEGEIIVDMFAGIGYFSLPIGKLSSPKKVYSIEMNPVAYEFLLKNIELNNLGDTIIPIKGNCKQEVIKLSKQGVQADRVIMGVFPAPVDYVDEALTLLKPGGTIYHFEGVVDKDKYLDLFEEFNEIAAKKGIICELKAKRFVKSYGPNLFHTVLDIEASK